MIVDSHCHLDFNDLYTQLDQVIKRAKSNNIEKMLTICTTLESFKKIKIIIDKYENVFGTFGIHPHEVKNITSLNSNLISQLVDEHKKIIGIGESGLDYYYNHSDQKLQKEAFVSHIHSAIEKNVPIIVHSRNAEIDTYEILKSESKNKKLKILIHCFTGSKNFAKKLLDINAFISVSGIITFKNSTELLDTVTNIPIENLLVETDSPYLSPDPLRGRINEPSNIVHVIEKLSAAKKISKEKVMNQTTKNFNKLFKLI